jgi:hypothetical protein
LELLLQLGTQAGGEATVTVAYFFPVETPALFQHSRLKVVFDVTDIF